MTGQKRWQYALALGVVSALLVGRWLVDPALGNRVAFLPLFIALLPLVLLVRAGPFLAAAVAGLLGTWYLFVPPRMNWRLAESASAVDSVVVITAIAIAAATAWVSRRSMDAREHDRAARRESEERLRFAITAGRLGDWDLDLDTGIARTSWQHDQCFGATEPFKPDGQYGVVCYFYDLSAIKRAENLLKEADRRKDEFLATLAHELRNPLAAIRMALAVVHGADGNRERIQQMSAIVDRQSSQLVRLVEDLLDVSRISPRKD